MGLNLLLTQLTTGTLSVIPALTQWQTNGVSTYGTMDARTFPRFLTDNFPSLTNSDTVSSANVKATSTNSSSDSIEQPWGSKTDYTTNAYTDSPSTGVVRTYNLTLTRGSIAPDGYQVPALMINGQYPGPTIEANWGDQIEVTVHNNITGPEEGTSIHWHGFLQAETPWDDGVPGISQCPIAPGHSYTYRFNASLYGSTWYHSHYSAQYSSGTVGPMVIFGPATAVAYDIDVGPVMLSDWYHDPYMEILETILAPNANPLYYSDNNLINGKMNFDCSTVKLGDRTPCTNGAGVAKFRFQTGKSHRMRLMNTGSEGVQRFSIDGHIMTVIANDFVPVVPYNTTVVTLGVGQRADVVVAADAGSSTSSWWIRSNITNCSLSNQPYAVAALYYDQAVTSVSPTSKAWNVPDPGSCTNDELSVTQPLYPIAVTTPNVTQTMVAEIFTNASDVTLWKFNNVSFRVDYNNPVLPLAQQGQSRFPAEWAVVNYHSNHTIRIIIENNSPTSHPMHLHGHNFLVLNEGAGQWDGTIVRPSNPQRRDTQLVRANGHLVLQFDGNPGVWVLHCHIAWHASGGFLAAVVIDQPQIRQFNIPSTIQDTCQTWQSWTQHNSPDMIDSGD